MKPDDTEVGPATKPGEQPESREGIPCVPYETLGQLTEAEGKKWLGMRLPRDFQGYTFVVNYRTQGDAQAVQGPFRIEYVLCNQFAIHGPDLASLDPEAGFSNLRVPERLGEPKRTVLQYSRHPGPPETRETVVSLRASQGVVQRVVIEVPEESIDVAVRVGDDFVTRLLDWICLRARVPLEVRHIEVYRADSGHLLRSYRTVPYTDTVDLTKEDIAPAMAMPPALARCLALFRAGVNSPDCHHRLLCLYRAGEALRRFAKKNTDALKKRGITPTRERRLVPGNQVTRRRFPQFVGKSAAGFLDHIRDTYRPSLAHAEPKDPNVPTLDPGQMKTQSAVDYVNAVLTEIVAQMIQDEWTLMQNHGLT